MLLNVVKKFWMPWGQHRWKEITLRKMNDKVLDYVLHT
jgi:hypothetical protein